MPDLDNDYIGNQFMSQQETFASMSNNMNNNNYNNSNHNNNNNNYTNNNNNPNNNNNTRFRSNNNNNQNPLFNVRDRLFHAIFYKAALAYARTFPRPVRRILEFIVLLKVIFFLLLFLMIVLQFSDFINKCE